MAATLRYRVLQALTRQANRFLSPKVPEPLVGDLFTRIYLDKMRARLAAAFPDRSELRILDAGCGAGRLCVALARDGHALTGIDYHEPSLEAARRAAAEAGVTLELRAGELRASVEALGDASFDAVICTEVLYTCADHREILAELVRVLAPGGLLLASFATRHYLITTLLRQRQWEPALFVAEHDEGVLRLARLPTYYNWCSGSDVEARCREQGLEVLAVEPIGSFCGHGTDGMAALVDLAEVTDPAALEALYRLETAGVEDTRATGRYLLAAARKPA